MASTAGRCAERAGSAVRPHRLTLPLPPSPSLALPSTARRRFGREGLAMAPSEARALAAAAAARDFGPEGGEGGEGSAASGSSFDIIDADAARRAREARWYR